MSGERIVYALMLVLALSLPLSALLRRRVAGGSALRLGLIWLAIIVGLLLVTKLLGLDLPDDHLTPVPARAAYFT